jgi:undecaprenyl-phosphate 4-deoxy-4-formamido-L-arabinose transferase
MPRIALSVVIPVYRSEVMLSTLIPRLLAVLDHLVLSHEIVLVEDGSPDHSWQVVRELHAAHPERIVAVQLMRNFGQHNALMCGFRHARGDYIVTMDDDLQNPPEEIPKLLAAIRDGEFDLVYGTYGAKRHSTWRNAGSALVNAFYRFTFRTDVTITSFRIIRRKLLECIFPYDLNFTFIDGLLAWNTQRIGEVSVEHHPRTSSRSGYDMFKLMSLAFNLFTNFSLLPLQLISFCGLAASAVGLFLGVLYLVFYLVHWISYPGYASTIISILVIGGIQLLALGVMGEYLGRLHINANRKPQYVERQVLGSASAPARSLGEVWQSADLSTHLISDENEPCPVETDTRRETGCSDGPSVRLP